MMSLPSLLPSAIAVVNDSLCIRGAGVSSLQYNPDTGNQNNIGELLGLSGINTTLGPCLEYDYPANDSQHVFNWNELAPVLAIYTLTYLIGVTGNVLIIYTIVHFRRLKSTTNVFLISLSSADLLLVLVCIPVKVRAQPN